MKVGDLIVGDRDQALMVPGYDFGLVIDEKPVDSDDPYETQYRVLWNGGRISYPARSYLEFYTTVVNEDR